MRTTNKAYGILASACKKCPEDAEQYVARNAFLVGAAENDLIFGVEALLRGQDTDPPTVVEIMPSDQDSL